MITSVIFHFSLVLGFLMTSRLLGFKHIGAEWIFRPDRFSKAYESVSYLAYSFFVARLRNLPIIAFTLLMLAGNLHYLPVPTVFAQYLCCLVR